jgi:hypothetical protein
MFYQCELSRYAALSIGPKGDFTKGEVCCNGYGGKVRERDLIAQQ